MTDPGRMEIGAGRGRITMGGQGGGWVTYLGRMKIGAGHCRMAIGAQEGGWVRDPGRTTKGGQEVVQEKEISLNQSLIQDDHALALHHVWTSPKTCPTNSEIKTTIEY